MERARYDFLFNSKPDVYLICVIIELYAILFYDFKHSPMFFWYHRCVSCSIALYQTVYGLALSVCVIFVTNVSTPPVPVSSEHGYFIRSGDIYQPMLQSLDGPSCPVFTKIIGHVGRTFPMAMPICLMRNFTNLNRIYKAHWTNIWWTMKVIQLHCKQQLICIRAALGQYWMNQGKSGITAC